MLYNLTSMSMDLFAVIVSTFPSIVELVLATDERGLVPPQRKLNFVGPFALLINKS